MHIVLVHPEIPQNTGNIARTCAATGMTLHLIKPLGFSLEDRYLKRAGLDYWRMMEYHVYERFDDLLSAYSSARMFFLTTKAPRSYAEVEYTPDDFLVFGCETRGLPESLLAKAYDRCVRIPMVEGARSGVVVHQLQGLPDRSQPHPRIGENRCGNATDGEGLAGDPTDLGAGGSDRDDF